MRNRHKLLVWECLMFVAVVAATGNFSLDLSSLFTHPTKSEMARSGQQPQDSAPGDAIVVPQPQDSASAGATVMVPQPQDSASAGATAMVPQSQDSKPQDSKPQDSMSASGPVTVPHPKDSVPAILRTIQLPQKTPKSDQSWEQEAKAKGLSFSVPAPFQAATVYAAKLNKPDKVIALTFDDGPWPKTTAQVLDILHQHNIKATFFWIGQNLELYPAIAQQVAAYGHAIGNHTWHHWYRPMDEATAASEIDRTAGLIYKITGLTTSLFRPPGGLLHNGVADYAKKQNYAVVMWSDDAYEFAKNNSAPRLVENVLRKAKSGEIVLLHDGGGNHQRTVEALPQIIAGLQQSGYRFVTVPELLEMQQQKSLTTFSAKSLSSNKVPVVKTPPLS